MKDKRKTKAVLIEELESSRQQIADLTQVNEGLQWEIDRQTQALEAVIEQMQQDIRRRKKVEAERERLLVSERKQRLLAETFGEITLALTAQLEEDAVLDEILHQAERLVPYAAAHIVMLEGEQLSIACWRGYEKFSSEKYIANLKQNLSDLPSEIEALQLKRPLVIPDTYHDPRWVIVPQTSWVRSYAVVPIYSRNLVLGLLRLDSDTPGSFSAEDISRLQPLTNSAAMALENARLHAAEQKQLRQLQQSQAQLIQSERMAAMGRLAASVTHEINNPLQSIQSCVTLIKEELNDALEKVDLVEIVNIAEQEIERISNLMHRMRAFYSASDLPDKKNSLGKSSLDVLNAFYSPDVASWRLVDVHETLTDVLQLATKELDRKSVSVEYMWADNLPSVQANAGYLKQVFLNLVLNAVEAMSESGGRLLIRTVKDRFIPTLHGGLSKQNHNNGTTMITPPCMVRIEFCDTGAGIPQNKILNLFEPLFTTKERGSGMGLFTTYKIVEAHNGQITVESQPNKGTIFTILLPTQQPV
jgi:signal transduction histidine kinase